MKKNNFSSERGSGLAAFLFVLVVIGLAIGAFMMAQQFLGSARTKGTIAQIEGYKTAVIGFKQLYNALPGDMYNVEKRVPGCKDKETGASLCEEGDGNGFIGETKGNLMELDQTLEGFPYSETLQFWRHLLAADMIGGFETLSEDLDIAWERSHPLSKLGVGGYHVLFMRNVPEGYSASGHFLRLQTFVSGPPVLGEGENVASYAEAIELEKKMDNGNLRSGNIIAVGPSCINEEEGSSLFPPKNCVLFFNLFK